MYLYNIIKVKIDIKIGIINSFLSIIDWIVIHLGRNPKNGGNPPILIRLIIKVSFINELFFNEEGICLTKNKLFFLKKLIRLIEMTE